MSHHHVPHSDDPKVQAYLDKVYKRERTVAHIFRRALRLTEWFIAVVTIVALLTALETGEFKGRLPVKLPELTFEA